MHPYLDVPLPLGMAHRGFSLEGLENTMVAFDAAVRLGMTHVETDVHATRDGALMAFHDDSLDRVTDSIGRIVDLSLTQVRAALVGGTQPIPLLEEVLGTWPELRVNIDVKGWNGVAPLVQVLRRTRALDRVCIASFDHRRTAAVRRALGGTLATSAGRREVVRWRMSAALPGALARAVGRPTAPGLVAYQVPTTVGPVRVVTPRAVRRAHEAGLQVHVWTVNDAAQMRMLLDLGVDGIISDRADTVAEVLRDRRGQA